MNDDLFKGGVEIRLNTDEDFLKVKETLTRIGVASRKENKLYQSCHILHKKGRYAILHFKQLFALDGKETDFSEEDHGRLNTIVKLLEEWGLVKIVNPKQVETPQAPLSQIKVLPYREKNNWTLVQKYAIGRKK